MSNPLKSVSLKSFGFVNPLKFLKGVIPSSYLGIDIGTTSIKVVEVKRGKKLPEIINYAFLEAGDYLGRSNSALQSSTLKLFDQDIIKLLKLVIKDMKPKTNEVLASLPIFSAFLTVLTFPEMEVGDLEKSITFQARQYIPLPLSDVAIDWLKIGEYEDERGYKQQQILLISVPQEQIKKYQYIFRAAGLRLRLLEVESLSVARVLVGNDSTPTLIVDIGSRSTNISFIEKGQLKYNSQTDFAGASLTQSLVSSLNINARRAEELKREKGILATGAEYELSTILLPFLDVIINEVKKALFNYQEQFPSAAKIERIILSGGGANLTGIEKYFSRELNLPAVKAISFSKFEYPAVLEPAVSELNPIFSVALGVILKKFL